MIIIHYIKHGLPIRQQRLHMLHLHILRPVRTETRHTIRLLNLLPRRPHELETLIEERGFSRRRCVLFVQQGVDGDVEELGLADGEDGTDDGVGGRWVMVCGRGFVEGGGSVA
jgi:hypothetical protein